MSVSVPYRGLRGNEYIIDFDDVKQIPTEVNLVSINLVASTIVSKRGIHNDLMDIGEIIRDYMINNNAVVYYYCDNDSSFSSEIRERGITPQNYRHSLFNSLFDRLNTTSYIKEDKIVTDNIYNDIHYISLISHVDNEEHLEDIMCSFEKIINEGK